MSQLGDGEPQFERMEPRGEAGPGTCASCSRSIADTYFEAAGKVFCEPCRDSVMASLETGSGASRLVKAMLLGGIAAALSAVVWYGVVKLTGYELGIIAVAAGIAVGGAVRIGAEQRGGWAYQTLAVVLTYLAIAASYVPRVLEEMDNQPAAEAAQAEVTPAGAPESSPPDAEVSPLLPAILISIIVPVFQVMDGGFIGLLIVLFALYEAWKINKRQSIAFSGPFRLQRPA